MTYLLAAQTVVLVLMAILIAGLLRSHAETLRRLPADPDEGSGGGGFDESTPELQIVAPPEEDRDRLEAVDISGATLDGDAVKVALTGGAPHTLLAFLSSGCLTCAGFWEALRPELRKPLPGGARPIVVTKDSSHESPSKLRELAPGDIPVVMSSEAWDAYSVPVAPYFVYVGAGGQVLGEGSAERWDQITSLFRDALADLDASAGEAGPADRGPAGDDNRAARARPGERLDEEDATLAAAGIRPGDSSLYPAEGEGRDA